MDPLPLRGWQVPGQAGDPVLMRSYLVGGAVRDRLLEREHGDRDWVVVGATPQQMLDAGYMQVGKDFPVFLHPQSKEEYALARTERKQGHGYTGFSVHFAPDVTLEQDLERRDLTVNAMAETDTGELVDPFNGRADLEARLLRHVSPAFVEDPLRVLRTARFAARFHHLGFTVAPETLALMAQITAEGELDYLQQERVWTEMERALAEPNPEIFIQVLRDCGALAALLPEVEALFGVPQTTEHHPEIDTGEHILLCLREAVQLSPVAAVRFAVLVHDLGKATTPTRDLPRHIAHEHRGVPLVKALCKRLGAPNRCRELALISCEYHLHCHRALELKGATVMKLLEKTDALRRPERFGDFLLVCEADARGRAGLQERDYPQAQYLRDALATVQGIRAADLAARGLQGPAIGAALREERVKALEARRPKNTEGTINGDEGKTND